MKVEKEASTAEGASLERERQRILEENQRRRRSVDAQRYAPWNRSEQFMVHGRQRLAAKLLEEAGVFPGPDSRCLEIGFGDGGWLPQLLAWRVPAKQIFGLELDAGRAAGVGHRLGGANLTVADAGRQPWRGNSFDLVVASTVLTSVLDEPVRRAIAAEIERVLKPGGALLWYDFAFNNPRNPNVRGLGRTALASLFPGLSGQVRRVTLAPPITRRVAPGSWWLAELLETLPFLRTHLLAVLVKR